MKDLFLFITVYIILLLAVFSVLFVSGCQENNITDPIYTESPETQTYTNIKADKNIQLDTRDYPKVIKLQQVLNLHFVPNTYFVVRGTIEVNHQVLKPVFNQAIEKYIVNVGLSVNAELNEMENDRNRWFIKEKTQETFHLIKGESTSFTQYYKVKGRNDGMQLAFKFEVDLDGVTLQSIWINIPRQHSANIVAQ